MIHLQIPNPDVRIEEVACSFCWNVWYAPAYPDRCHFCKMGSCSKCAAWLKETAKFCHGCGAIAPEISARIGRTSSTGMAYSYEWWKKWTLVRDLKKASKINPLNVSFICGSKEHWIFKADGTPVRKLTKEEVAILKGEE